MIDMENIMKPKQKENILKIQILLNNLKKYLVENIITN